MQQKSDNTTKTIALVMAFTLIGKVLGLYRDRLLAIHYSTGIEASAFFTASRIPRVFFDAVFASAIAACFIPVFSQTLEKNGKEKAYRFAGAFITLIALLTAALTALGMLFPQPLVVLFSDYENQQTIALACSLTKVMFPTVLFSGIAFSLVGVLQALGHFTAPALMSAVANLVIIAYFFFGNASYGIYGLALAYLVGWLLQGLIQLPPARRLGYRFRPSLHFFSSEMDQVFALMLPVMISTWVQPINLVINSRFGSRLLNGGGVAAMEYSSNLYLVIAGTFILSVTNVMFPQLARLSAGGAGDDFHKAIRQTLHGCLFFVLPMAAGLMVVAGPLISLIYGGGRFDAAAIDVTTTALVWMSGGMVGYALQNILSRAYFARQNGRTPLLAGAISIAVNLLLCSVLLAPMGIAGLALASAVSSTVYGLLLLIPMQRQDEPIFNRVMCFDVIKMLLCAALTALAARWVGGLFPQLAHIGKLGDVTSLALSALAGGIVYFVSALACRLPEVEICINMLKKRTRREK